MSPPDLLAADGALPDPSQVDALLDRLRDLPTLRGDQRRLQRLAHDYRRSIELEGYAAVVAVLGATGAGKSTLVNALSGEALAQEGEDRPTSRVPIAYAPRAVRGLDLPQLSLRTVRYDGDRAPTANALVLIDTPDLNSVAREHQEAARGALERSDVALVVMHRGSVVEAVQAAFLGEFARRRRLVFALNFADELGEAARQDLKAQVRALWAPKLGLAARELPVFAVSAREARRGGEQLGEFRLLCAHLDTLTAQAGADQVRQGNAVAVLRELSGLATAAAAHLDETGRAVRDALALALARVSPLLREDFEDRLSLTAAHLKTTVKREAASLWWGPAAWLMRLSALGGSGLAAAGLVARANLPAGLAVAAASAVLDQATKATRQHLAERRVVRAAEVDGRIASLVRQALTAARAAAHQKGFAPEQLGLPSEEGALERLRALRDAAWQHTQTLALGEAVRRWWRWARWLLVPLVNLPLLALLADVAYRVVRAYLTRDYLPGSYYLNAAGMAAALSAFGTLAASLSLAGVARRVRSLGAAFFDAQLQAFAAELLQDPAANAAPLLAAAQALAATAPAAVRHDNPPRPAPAL